MTRVNSGLNLFYFTFLLVLIINAKLEGQTSHCEFDIIIDTLTENGSNEIQEIIDENNSLIQNYLNPPQGLAFSIPFEGTKQIPIVFHVMHDPGDTEGFGTNVAESILLDAVEQLNDDFMGANNGYDTGITFCLAKKDSNGNPTNGIIRVAVSDTDVTDYSNQGIIPINENNSNEIDLKSLSVFPSEEYYNIWVVSNTSTGFLGYAYLPGTVAPNIDGAVILYSELGFNKHILSHEIGHSLNMYHTFEGDVNGTTCPPSDPLLGDFCEDTDPHIRLAFNCPTNQSNTCSTGSTLDMVKKNFMNYSSQICQSEFTEDQAEIMNCALSLFRPGLLTLDKCIDFCTGSNANFSGPSLGFVGEELFFELEENLILFPVPQGSHEWFVNNQSNGDGNGLEIEFESSGVYFICYERNQNGCFNRTCQEVLILEESTCSLTANAKNGKFDQFSGTPEEPWAGGNSYVDFINDDLESWFVVNYTPDFWSNGFDSENSIGLLSPNSGGLQAEEGIFQCFLFEQGETYNICMDIRGLGSKNLAGGPDSYSYIASNGELHLYASNALLPNNQNNPTVGEELITSFVNNQFEEWTTIEFQYMPNADYSSFMIMNAFNENWDRSYFLIDNISIIAEDLSGFELVGTESICVGGGGFIDAIGGTNYQWFDDEGQEIECGPNCNQIFVTPSETTTYTVVITNDFNDACFTQVELSHEVIVDCNLPCEVTPDPSFSIDDNCEFTFFDLNDFTNINYSYLWTFGDGFTGSGPSVTYAYNHGGVFQVCLKIDCGDNFSKEICLEVEVDDESCNECLTLPPIFATTCEEESTDPFMAIVDIVIPDGYTFCENQESIFYSTNQDVNYYISSYELDNIENMLSASVSFTPVDQTNFLENGTTLFITLCDEFGNPQCFEVVVRPKVCENCFNELTTAATCVFTNQQTGESFYEGSIIIEFPSDVIGECGYFSSAASFQFSQNIIGNQVELSFSFSSEISGLSFIESLLCYEVSEIGESCITIFSQLDECPNPPDECVQIWDPKEVECTRWTEESVTYNFAMSFEMGIAALNYSICDHGLEATLSDENGNYISNSTINVLSSGEFNGFFEFDIDIALPCIYIGSQLQLRLYFCDSGGRAVCYLFPLNFSECENACDRSDEIEVRESSKLKPIVSIYPNPATDQLNLYLLDVESKQHSFVLLDQLGKVVMRQSFGLDTVLDLDQISEGVYYIKVLDVFNKVIEIEKISVIR